MTITGVGAAASILQVIERASSELEGAYREQSRANATRALRQGEQQAAKLRDAASSARTGAAVGGITAGIGAGLQMYSAAGTRTGFDPSDRSGAARMEANNDKMGRLSAFGGSLVALGGYQKDFLTADGKFAEADATKLAAGAESASRYADADAAAAEQVHQTQSKARDHYQKIIELDHAAKMAILRA